MKSKVAILLVMRTPWNLFAVLIMLHADGTMKSVGHLFAACLSLCDFGAVPNFLYEWVHDFIIGGPNEVYKKLPDKLLDCKNELREIYE